MKKVVPTVLVAVSMMLLACSANASVLIFDDVSGTAPFIPLAGTGYGGFMWNRNAYAGVDYYSTSGWHTGVIGSRALVTMSGDDTAMGLNTGLFDFQGAYFTAGWEETLSVDVEGWDSSGMIYSKTINVNNDAPMWIDFDFDGIDTLWFKPTRDDDHLGDHLLVDNVTYALTGNGGGVVPEPASMLLFGTGLAGFAAVRKRT